MGTRTRWGGTLTIEREKEETARWKICKTANFNYTGARRGLKIPEGMNYNYQMARMGVRTRSRKLKDAREK